MVCYEVISIKEAIFIFSSINYLSFLSEVDFLSKHLQIVYWVIIAINEISPIEILICCVD